MCRRHDYLCNGLQTLAESLLFFHPAVWWLSRRIRLEREYCCDDLAVKLCGDRVVYAETLAAIEESVGKLGFGLSAGEKPLLKRVRRVLGVNPKPRNQFSSFGIWGASVLVAVSLGFVLVSSGEIAGGKEATASEVSEATSEVKVMGDKPLDEISCYQRLSDLNNEVKELLKSGNLEEAEARILEELPAISEGWLSADYDSLAHNQARSLQETIAEDRRLFPTLVEKILAIDQAEPTTAAMLDIVGAEEKARAAYRKVLASDPNSPAAIGLHLVRLSEATDLGPLLELLNGNAEPQKIRNALSSAFHASKTFEQSIDFLNAISKYLEQVAIDPDARFDWVSFLFESADWRRNQVYGDFQLPTVWEPNAPHDNNMIGKPSNAAQREVRRQAYERYCTACLRIPDQAAWGFAQLGALADLEGKFDSNSKLVEQARKALMASGKPTKMGRFATAKAAPRFFTPELYLAYAQWKGQAKNDDAFKLTEPVMARIKQLQQLLSVPAVEFTATAKVMLDEPAFAVADELNVEPESDDAIAMRRFHDVLLIWNERQNDANIEHLVLRLVLVDTDWRGDFVSIREAATKIVINYLRVVANSKKPAEVRDFLEEVTTIYLGLPAKRAKSLEALPDPGILVDWARVPPPAVQYLGMLNQLVNEPVLIFPALEKASELGLMGRMRIHDWIKASDFQTMPEQVIARLDLSPLVGELADFKPFSRSSGMYFPSNYPEELTLLDWVVAEIGKLNAADQKAFP